MKEIQGSAIGLASVISRNPERKTGSYVASKDVRCVYYLQTWYLGGMYPKMLMLIESR